MGIVLITDIVLKNIELRIKTVWACGLIDCLLFSRQVSSPTMKILFRIRHPGCRDTDGITHLTGYLPVILYFRPLEINIRNGKRVFFLNGADHATADVTHHHINIVPDEIRAAA